MPSTKLGNFSLVHRELTLSNDLYRNLRGVSVVGPLEEMASSLCLVLSVYRERMEAEDIGAEDESLIAANEMVSLVLCFVLQKLEAMSICKATKLIMDQGVEIQEDPSLNAVGDTDVQNQLATFFIQVVASHPRFLSLSAQLFPRLQDWLPNVQGEFWRHLAEFVASYYCLPSSTVLPGPSALRQRLSAPESPEYEAEFEAFLFPLIFRVCRDRTLQAAEDKLFAEQCRRFADASQDDFIRGELHSTTGWSAAQQQLLKLAVLITPFEMLECTTATANAIFREAKAILNGTPIGGDDLLDIFCFVCLSSNVPNLPSIVAYMLLFMGEGSSENHYYWTSLQLAVTFITKMTSVPLRAKDK